MGGTPADPRSAGIPAGSLIPSPYDWWEELLPILPHLKPPGPPDMLRLVAYDIADPRRLAKVADICEDFGNRVQYSLFECWLDDQAFERLWSRLLLVIEPTEDRLVAYPLDIKAARERRTAGDTMQCTQAVAYYLI